MWDDISGEHVGLIESISDDPKPKIASGIWCSLRIQSRKTLCLFLLKSSEGDFDKPEKLFLTVTQ